MKFTAVILALLLLKSVYAFGQMPPEQFFKGLGEIQTDVPQAKIDFAKAIEIAPQFHGSYHFMGVIYLGERETDSAIVFLTKSAELNKQNVNHTTGMTYIRLANAYTSQNNFVKAFDAAWRAYQLNPEGRANATTLKDVCLWSFYIKYDHMSTEYLSPDLKDEYIVNSIPQEYLIVRNIRLKGEYLNVNGQSLVEKNGASYDVLKCVASGTKKETADVYFKLNWNMNKEFGGKTAPTAGIIADTATPVYERVGAMLAADSKTDIKAEIEKMLK